MREATRDERKSTELVDDALTAIAKAVYEKGEVLQMLERLHRVVSQHMLQRGGEDDIRLMLTMNETRNLIKSLGGTL